MLQTSVALSRKHSQDRRHQQNAVDEQLGPRENSQLALLDCSNLSLGQLPLELLNEQAGGLKHLILDENQLDEQALEEIPELPKLETLSLNGNCVKNIGVLFQILCRKVPQLKCLSLIGNPGWPHPILNGNNLQFYRKYALSAVQMFPTLQFLDTARVHSGHQNNTSSAAGGNGGAIITLQRNSLATIAATACRIV